MKFQFLLKISVLSLIIATEQSILNTAVAHSQSRTYFCQSSQTSHNVVMNFRGIRSLINWNPGEEARCNDVSNRFESARESGNLRFLVKEGNNICGTNTDVGRIRCSRILTSLDGVNPNSLLVRLFNDRLQISGASIVHSNGIQYINWEDLLRNESLSSQLLESR